MLCQCQVDSEGSCADTYICSPPNVFPLRLLCSIEQSFLSYTVGPYWLSIILNMYSSVYKSTPGFQFIPQMLRPSNLKFIL